MDIEKFGWVKDGMIPFVEVGGNCFYGLPGSQYPTVFEQITLDVKERYQANRPYPQHRHYTYRSQDTVVEIGAFLGYYTMSVAERVGQVLAIEMIPDLYKIMCMNLAPYPNVTTIMKGVASGRGTVIACKGDRQQSSLRHEVTEQYSLRTQDEQVECDTIDSILDDNKINEVDFMVIQVNGSELEVLEGLSLERVKNLAIATPYTEEGVVRDILRTNGFEVKGDKVMVYGLETPKHKEVA